MSELRLFTAVRPPESVLDAIERHRRRLGDAIGSNAVRWVPRANYHVTLEFLGATPESQIPGIEAALQATAAAATARPELVVTRPGAFPGIRRPRTLWVGVEDPEGTLAGLERDLRARLSGLGLGLDERPFRPHVTIGYVRRQAGPAARAAISRALDAFGRGANGMGDASATFRVDSILLVHSVTGPGGSRYTDLHAVGIG